MPLALRLRASAISAVFESGVNSRRITVARARSDRVSVDWLIACQLHQLVAPHHGRHDSAFIWTRIRRSHGRLSQMSMALGWRLGQDGQQVAQDIEAVGVHLCIGVRGVVTVLADSKKGRDHLVTTFFAECCIALIGHLIRMACPFLPAC